MKRDSKCWEHKYICTGENWRRDYPIGDCGDTKTLISWVEKFFPDKIDTVLKRLEYAAEKSVCEYIYLNTGKRIEKVR
nr:hypothetical protein [uncultured Butyrivibrio sp.]